MIVGLIKFIITFIFFGCIYWASSFYDRNILIIWSSYEIEISTIFLVASSILLLVLMVNITNLLGWIYNIPARIYQNFIEKKDKNNIHLLLDGFAAIVNEEMQELKKIDHHLQRSTKGDLHFKSFKPLLDILHVHATIAANDLEVAENILEKMIAQDDSKSIGLKLMVKLKLLTASFEEALKYCKAAWAMKCRDKWLFQAYIKIYTEQKQYKQLEEILQASQGYKYFDLEFLNQELAKANVEIAKQLLGSQKISEAIPHLQKAIKIDNQNIEAAILLIRAYLIEESVEVAFAALEKIYYYNPNKRLAEMVLELYEKNNIDEKLEKFEILLSFSKARETYETIIEFLIYEKQFEVAKKYIGIYLSKFGSNPLITKQSNLIKFVIGK